LSWRNEENVALWFYWRQECGICTKLQVFLQAGKEQHDVYVITNKQTNKNERRRRKSQIH